MANQRILQNQVKCNKCGDTPYSTHRHHYQPCKCGAVAVDGGMDYLRRNHTGNGDYEDLSVVIHEDLYQELCKQLDWAKETGRNNLGTICALARGLRDSGYEIKRKKEATKLYKAINE